jgi:murein L,D-transpeptidase YafK
MGTTRDEIASILANIYQWRYAWKISNIDDYLKFYNKGFRRFDGKNLEQFARYKRLVFSGSFWWCADN